MDTYPWPDCRDIRNRSKSYSFSILDEMCDYYCYPNNPTHLPPLDSNLEPLQHLPLEPQSLEIMECLTHSKDQCGVFRVSALVEGKRQQAILKLYHSGTEPQDRDLASGDYSFDRETRAYQNLIHYGLCKHRQSPDDRVVPYFYGVIEFTAWPPPQAASGLPDHWLEFRGDTTKPKAILVEYIEDACQMGLGNLSEKVALDALNAYVRIMEAYVLQCDFYPRNVLVDSRGRVVIIDFGVANTHPDHTRICVDSACTFQELTEEQFYDVFELLFMRLIPDLRRVKVGLPAIADEAYGKGLLEPDP